MHPERMKEIAESLGEGFFHDRVYEVLTGRTEHLPRKETEYLTEAIGFMDNVKAIGYYDWSQGHYYQYIDWTRMYDKVMINVSVFYDPDNFTGSAGFNQRGRQRGSGVQLLVTFNH